MLDLGYQMSYESLQGYIFKDTKKSKTKHKKQVL